MPTQKQYTPALRFHFLTPIYDWVVKWSSKERLFKQRLIQQAALIDGLKVLDIGCGTGSLLYMIGDKHEKHNKLELHGIDIDQKSLRIARKKLKRKQKNVQIHHAPVTQLPFNPEYFDKVFCSLMFHHLTDKDKSITLKEIYRVIKPGGELHFADWGKPSSIWIRMRFLIVQLIDGFNTTKASLTDFVYNEMLHTGFSVLETGRVKALVGEIVLLKATKPNNIENN